MENIQKIIEEMTLEEKASLCSGMNFWYLKGLERFGIPSIMVTDGPHGLRKQEGKGDHIGLNESAPATCFPTASALAATWDRDLVYQVGVALGEECRQEKVAVILGPGVNIKRSPLCGRNFEYFSEDPYLAGEMAKSHISGVQSQGVGTSLKHFAANDQEYRRATTDSVVDERALHEIYLTAFEIAVREAQPWTVMSSYNKINGTYASDNKFLLTDILREEWGFNGFVVTDWGGMNERVKALEAGNDLEMPGPSTYNDELIIDAVLAGRLDEDILDRALERMLTVIFKANDTLSVDFHYDSLAHQALARKVAAEGAVLLKNEGGLLPLKPGSKIALVGRFAKAPRYQGAGSSLINPSKLENLYEELGKLIGEEKIIYAPGYDELGETTETLLAEAVEATKSADVVVVCAGLVEMAEVEGVDRDTLSLTSGHDELIQRVAAAHKKVAVVLSNGAPVAMPWLANVSAVLEGYLGGQAGAGGLAEVLTGKVCPSGKLAETFPLSLQDTPAKPYPGGPVVVEYRESLYVGYRYYDTAKVDVLFPFGFGLSYTKFDYSDLNLKQAGDKVTVSFKVKNSGSVAGKEIAQVYVRDVESTWFRPKKELKGFTKVELQPGEEKEVSVELGPRAFAYYDTGSKGWVVETGEFEIVVGASSRDIRLKVSYKLAGQGVVSGVDTTKLAPYYNVTPSTEFSQAAFEALLGRPVPPNIKPGKGEFTMNTPLADMTDSFMGRQMNRVMQDSIGKMIKGQENTPTGLTMTTMAKEMPLRSIAMGGGPLNLAKLRAILLMINGHMFLGIKALFRNK
jgi:beta-glucosidase